MTRAATKRHAGRVPKREARKRAIVAPPPVAWVTLDARGFALRICVCDPPCVDVDACPSGDPDRD